MSFLNPYEGKKKATTDGPIKSVPPIKDDSGLDKHGDGFDVSLPDDDSTGGTKPMPKPTSQDSNPKAKGDPKPAPESKKVPEPKPEPKPTSDPKPEPEPKEDPEPKPTSELKAKEDPKPEPKPKPKKAPEPEPKPAPSKPLRPEDVGFMPGVYFTPEQLAAVEARRLAFGESYSPELIEKRRSGELDDDILETTGKVMAAVIDVLTMNAKARQEAAENEAKKWRPAPIIPLEWDEEGKPTKCKLFLTKWKEVSDPIDGIPGLDELAKARMKLPAFECLWAQVLMYQRHEETRKFREYDTPEFADQAEEDWLEGWPDHPVKILAAVATAATEVASVDDN